MNKFLWVLYIGVIGTAAVIGSIYFIWWVRSLYMLKRAGPRKLRAHRKTIWRDPGIVERLDFRSGPGGRDKAPAPPFHFLEEHSSGSNPCLSVSDAKGRIWRVKWGDEVRSETFAVRVVWAAGYHAETTYFVSEGRIEGAGSLARARSCVGEDCSFKDARFELDDRSVKKLFDEHGWAWNDNPFVGTRELNGLKIIMMLLSNWDNKDIRDVARGSNTAIFQHSLSDGIVEARYLIIDWGATMGRWGTVGFRQKWDSAAYEAQTPDLVKGVEDGFVKWGYLGQRTEDATEGISVEDVRWLCRYVGRVTDNQIREGLIASGATDEEVESFTRAFRDRVNLLKRIGETGEASESRASPPTSNA
jgi:hypothetical protein